MQWKQEVLTSGPPGNSLKNHSNRRALVFHCGLYLRFSTADEAEHFSRGLQTIIYLFFFFAALSLPCFLCRLSPVAASEGYSSCGAQASHCSGFSCCRAQALGSWASAGAALELSSCGVWVRGRSGFNSCSIQAEKLWLVGPRAHRLH